MYNLQENQEITTHPAYLQISGNIHNQKSHQLTYVGVCPPPNTHKPS